ncbi:malonate decarboxylase holo-ACP synthase [Fictibacillus fluitans]|uniref:Malonate decarboxylase holo-ACP synthase n=1 Tax=Fictibacillus fluitans TaxID=3058422 RepID=A0ABT8HYV5_9BACL|nr:malonate decarboxylase holo-ACP synthase [Fictibacillus sp. NE201]MDN4525942.1 malonate decarboxylase holo-ACP synthase [Fictibacillus sp. NE201]
MEIKTHDLIRVDDLSKLVCLTDVPQWVGGELAAKPFVVVRRAAGFEGRIPVGIRGETRSQRFGCFLPVEECSIVISPEQLAEEKPWKKTDRRLSIVAIEVLDRVDELMASEEMAWGPTGSVGFELASGLDTAHSGSDLDLVIRCDQTLPVEKAKRLIQELSQFPVHIDVQVETGKGSCSLAEYSRGQESLLLKTENGPMLVKDPWSEH